MKCIILRRGTMIVLIASVILLIVIIALIKDSDFRD